MNREFGVGLLERMIYTVVLAGAMKLVSKGWIDSDMAIYIAVTAQALPSAAWAWWINRPQKLLDAASNQIPENAKLVIATTPAATPADQKQAQALAGLAGEKVVAKTTA